MLVQSSDCVRKPSDLARFQDDFFEQISTLPPEERWEHEHANKNEAKSEPTPDDKQTVLDFSSILLIE